jgi:ketosteroid isomerase-like protein
MTVQEIGTDLVALCQVGNFEEAMKRHYSPDIVSVEAMGDNPEIKGIEATAAKGEWWSANHEVHGIEVEGPFVNGEQFSAIFRLDITPKATGKREVVNEVALYTIEGGKIVREVFFY